jgi:hypothetical protein
MAKTTVQQVERIQAAIEAASHWYNMTITDQITDFIVERLRLHRELPTLIAAAQYQLDEIQGIVNTEPEKP